MDDRIQLVIGISALLCTAWIIQQANVWRIKRTCRKIIEELRQSGAVDPSSAVKLPYSKRSFFMVGVRDYRPRALELLVSANIIGRTEEGGYFLAGQEKATSNAKAVEGI